MTEKNLLNKKTEDKKESKPLNVVGQETLYTADLKKMGKKKKATLTNQVRVSSNCLEKINILTQILGYARSNELLETLLDKRIGLLTEDEQNLYEMAKRVYNIPKR